VGVLAPPPHTPTPQTPNPQSPIPNPQYFKYSLNEIILKKVNDKIKIKYEVKYFLYLNF